MKLISLAITTFFLLMGMTTAAEAFSLNIGSLITAAVAIFSGAGLAAAAFRVAAGLAVSYITNKLFAPEAPAGGPATPDPGVKQRISTDTANKLPVVYGQAKVHGSITHAAITGDNQTMAFIIPLCEGPIDSIQEIHWDSYRLSFGGESSGASLNTLLTGNDAVSCDGAVDNFGRGDSDDFLNGHLRVRAFLGGDSQRCSQMEAFDTAQWGDANAEFRTMPNVVYLYVELDYDREDGVTALSNKLGAVIRGRTVRTISRTGTGVFGDEFAYSISNTESYSNNPAECLLDFLRNERYGCGEIIRNDSEIDLQRFYNHKAYCDTATKFIPEGLSAFDITSIYAPNDMVTYTDPVTNVISAYTANTNISAGAFDADEWDLITEKRFALNGVINTNDSRDLTISDICSNSQAVFSYQLGLFQMNSDRALTGTELSNTRTFNEDDTYGDISFVNDGFNSQLNQYVGTFVSRDNQHQDEQVFLDIPTALRNQNEPQFTQENRLKFIDNSIQAERLGFTILRKSRDALIISFSTDIRAITLQVNDVIRISNDVYGFGNKPFRINSIAEVVLEGGLLGYSITAQEYNSSAYSDDVANPFIAFALAPNVNIPNTRNIGTPTQFTSTGQDANESSVSLRWTVPNGFVESFEIFYSVSPTELSGDDLITALSESSPIAVVTRPMGGIYETDPADVVDYTILDAPAGDHIYYWVRAANTYGYKGPFTPVPVLIEDFTPAIVTNLDLVSIYKSADSEPTDLPTNNVIHNFNDGSSVFVATGLVANATLALNATAIVVDDIVGGVSDTGIITAGDEAISYTAFDSSTSTFTVPALTQDQVDAFENGAEVTVNPVSSNDWFLQASLATGGTNLYIRQGTVTNLDTIITFNPNEWSPPRALMGGSGTDGRSVTVIDLYQAVPSNMAAPAVPTSTAGYTFTTNTLTGQGTWLRTVPAASTTHTIWTTQGYVSTTTPGTAVTGITWSAPTVFQNPVYEVVAYAARIVFTATASVNDTLAAGETSIVVDNITGTIKDSGTLEANGLSISYTAYNSTTQTFTLANSLTSNQVGAFRDNASVIITSRNFNPRTPSGGTITSGELTGGVVPNASDTTDGLAFVWTNDLSAFDISDDVVYRSTATVSGTTVGAWSAPSLFVLAGADGTFGPSNIIRYAAFSSDNIAQANRPSSLTGVTGTDATNWTSSPDLLGSDINDNAITYTHTSSQLGIISTAGSPSTYNFDLSGTAPADGGRPYNLTLEYNGTTSVQRWAGNTFANGFADFGTNIPAGSVNPSAVAAGWKIDDRNSGIITSSDNDWSILATSFGAFTASGTSSNPRALFVYVRFANGDEGIFSSTNSRINTSDNIASVDDFWDDMGAVRIPTNAPGEQLSSGGIVSTPNHQVIGDITGDPTLQLWREDDDTDAPVLFRFNGLDAAYRGMNIASAQLRVYEVNSSGNITSATNRQDLAGLATVSSLQFQQDWQFDGDGIIPHPGYTIRVTRNSASAVIYNRTTQWPVGSTLSQYLDDLIADLESDNDIVSAVKINGDTGLRITYVSSPGDDIVTGWTLSSANSLQDSTNLPTLTRTNPIVSTDNQANYIVEIRPVTRTSPAVDYSNLSIFRYSDSYTVNDISVDLTNVTDETSLYGTVLTAIRNLSHVTAASRVSAVGGDILRIEYNNNTFYGVNGDGDVATGSSQGTDGRKPQPFVHFGEDTNGDIISNLTIVETQEGSGAGQSIDESGNAFTPPTITFESNVAAADPYNVYRSYTMNIDRGTDFPTVFRQIANAYNVIFNGVFEDNNTTSTSEILLTTQDPVLSPSNQALISGTNTGTSFVAGVDGSTYNITITRRNSDEFGDVTIVLNLTQSIQPGLETYFNDNIRDRGPELGAYINRLGTGTNTGVIQIQDVGTGPTEFTVTSTTGSNVTVRDHDDLSSIPESTIGVSPVFEETGDFALDAGRWTRPANTGRQV